MIPLPAYIDPEAWAGFCDMRRFMCGCIKLQAGGVFKRGMPWKCADCAKGGK